MFPYQSIKETSPPSYQSWFHLRKLSIGHHSNAIKENTMFQLIYRPHMHFADVRKTTSPPFTQVYNNREKKGAEHPLIIIKKVGGNYRRSCWTSYRRVHYYSRKESFIFISLYPSRLACSLDVECIKLELFIRLVFLAVCVPTRPIHILVVGIYSRRCLASNIILTWDLSTPCSFLLGVLFVLDAFNIYFYFLFVLDYTLLNRIFEMYKSVFFY